MKHVMVLALCLMPIRLAAHPHVFIDTGLDVIFDDQNRLTHVRVTWGYDQLYSLFILEDMNLDKDADNVLTAEETAKLTGFDMNWDSGFSGDLEVFLDGQKLKLSVPLEPTAELRDGRIFTTHLREVTGTPDTGGAPVSLMAYDESFYTNYDITLPVRVIGPQSCFTERIEPDIDQKLADMLAFLETLDANADLQETGIPMAGADFATEIRVTCPGS